MSYAYIHTSQMKTESFLARFRLIRKRRNSRPFIALRGRFGSSPDKANKTFLIIFVEGVE